MDDRQAVPGGVGEAVQLGLDPSLDADQDDRQARLSPDGLNRPLNDRTGGVVPPHGVQHDPHRWFTPSVVLTLNAKETGQPHHLKQDGVSHHPPRTPSKSVMVGEGSRPCQAPLHRHKPMQVQRIGTTSESIPMVNSPRFATGIGIACEIDQSRN